MSRVYLISTNTAVEPYPVFPLGMALVAGALAAHGHEVRQFDLLASGQDRDLLRRELADFAPDNVGLSLRNIDNVDFLSPESIWYLKVARGIAQLVRETTAAPLLVGGAAFTIMPEEILAFLGGDYGVAGEGEDLACELVEALEEGRQPPRILRPAPQRARSLPRQAPPLVEERWAAFYLRETGLLNLQTKRGCPHRCTYCTYPLIEGNCFRPRDPAEVAEDLLRLKRDHGVEQVFFTDSVFNDVAGHHLRVAEELIRCDVGVRWGAIFRPQRTGRAELALLKRAGLFAMELGTDAASDTTLAALQKGFTFAEVLDFNRACVAERIPAAHFIMFGVPGETEATVREGLENIERLEQCVIFAFSGIRVLPGTGIRDRAVSEGLLAPDASLLEPVYYHAPGVDLDTMHAMITNSFRKRRERIFPPSEGRLRVQIMRKFRYGGLLWDSLIRFSR